MWHNRSSKSSKTAESNEISVQENAGHIHGGILWMLCVRVLVYFDWEFEISKLVSIIGHSGHVIFWRSRCVLADSSSKYEFCEIFSCKFFFTMKLIRDDKVTGWPAGWTWCDRTQSLGLMPKRAKNPETFYKINKN